MALKTTRQLYFNCSIFKIFFRKLKPSKFKMRSPNFSHRKSIIVGRRCIFRSSRSQRSFLILSTRRLGTANARLGNLYNFPEGWTGFSVWVSGSNLLRIWTFGIEQACIMTSTKQMVEISRVVRFEIPHWSVPGQHCENVDEWWLHMHARMQRGILSLLHFLDASGFFWRARRNCKLFHVSVLAPKNRIFYKQKHTNEATILFHCGGLQTLSHSFISRTNTGKTSQVRGFVFFWPFHLKGVSCPHSPPFAQRAWRLWTMCSWQDKGNWGEWEGSGARSAIFCDQVWQRKNKLWQTVTKSVTNWCGRWRGSRSLKMALSPLV